MLSIRCRHKGKGCRSSKGFISVKERDETKEDNGISQGYTVFL